MLEIEHRQMYGANGLIDDFVLYGSPADYIVFAKHVEMAVGRLEPVALGTASRIEIEIQKMVGGRELFTSLQNKDNFYSSMGEWSARDILRVRGSAGVLEGLCGFLVDLSQLSDGYSYISEFSVDFAYSATSPEWRLHVQRP